MKNIYIQILDRKTDPLVLATVTGVDGSTPQKPGSSALFGPVGLLTGTVGGGILEGEVQKLALKAIQTKESGHYHFNLDQDISHKEEAICGGTINVLVDASPSDHHNVFEQMHKSLLNRIPGVLVTMVRNMNEEKVLIHRYWFTGKVKDALPYKDIQETEEEAEKILSSGKNDDYKIIPGKEKDILFFLEPVFAPFHLVIAGAGHIGKALTHIAKLLDFEVTVIDDRDEYANPVNLPEADHIIVDEIGMAMWEIKKKQDTYIVIVTRGHKDDAEALKPCINSEAGYIGMIGSKNKIALMKNDFIGAGWASPRQWEKIYAPIGLEIQSKSVQEIAVSIAAQLVLVRNNK
jgi:xanthine dehydrogenase accessory factor